MLQQSVKSLLTDLKAIWLNFEKHDSQIMMASARQPFNYLNITHQFQQI